MLSNLRIRQVEQKLRAWRSLEPDPPRTGWLRLIREAIGMTRTQLAHRLGVSRQSVAEIEQREIDRTITLRSLERAAVALDCRLIYAIVPRKEIPALIADRARQIAIERIQRVAHSMQLEAQGVDADETQHLVDELAAEFLAGPLRELWTSSDEPTRKRDVR